MITIRGLRKTYGALNVLNGIDLIVSPGRVTAVVGPNAAGKTTLIKAILGLVRCEAGSIDVAGIHVNGDETYRREIGYMPQIARFPANLTGAELLAMLRNIRRDVVDIDDDLLKTFGLGLELTKKLNDLSGGTKQKINAVAAFLFRPRILILDEPTAGLDPSSSRILKDKIQAEKKAGRTFIITSHVMSELEELADDVVFMSDGKVRFSGSLEQIKRLTRKDDLERAVAELINQGIAA
jgi:Cu-processing system ATP-binding protein